MRDDDPNEIGVPQPPLAIENDANPTPFLTQYPAGSSNHRPSLPKLDVLL